MRRHRGRGRPFGILRRARRPRSPRSPPCTKSHPARRVLFTRTEVRTSPILQALQLWRACCRRPSTHAACDRSCGVRPCAGFFAQGRGPNRPGECWRHDRGLARQCGYCGVKFTFSPYFSYEFARRLPRVRARRSIASTVPGKARFDFESGALPQLGARPHRVARRTRGGACLLAMILRSPHAARDVR